MTFAHIEALGFVDTTRGKNGGIRLSKDAERVSIGAVVRKTEPDLNLLECFDPRTDHCTISTVCRLKSILRRAKGAFLNELDAHTPAAIGALPSAAIVAPLIPARRVR